MERDVFISMAQTQASHWWFAARRLNLEALLCSLPSPQSVLEVGCGTGANLEMLSAFGEVTAVELDDEARAFAGIACPRARVLNGRLPDGLPHFGRRFDLICLFDVLEHVEDDVASLRALRKHLAPGGHVVVSVPAYQWLFGAHDRRHHHHRRYSRSALTTAANNAGLRPVRLGHFNTILFPIAVAQRVAAAAGLSREAMDAQPTALVNGSLKTLFGLERFVIPRALFPYGLSLIGVFTLDD